ncbi:MAG: hypothetical protein ACH346_00635 [Chthoniobacterales bacterium]
MPSSFPLLKKSLLLAFLFNSICSYLLAAEHIQLEKDVFSNLSSNSSSSLVDSSALTTETIVDVTMEDFLSLDDASALEAQDPDFLKEFFPVTTEFYSVLINTLVQNGSDDFLKFYNEEVASVITLSTTPDGLSHFSVMEGQEEKLLGYLRGIDPIKNNQSSASLKNQLPLVTTTTSLFSSTSNSTDSPIHITKPSLQQISPLEKTSQKGWWSSLSPDERSSLSKMSGALVMATSFVLFPEFLGLAELTSQEVFLAVLCTPCAIEFFNNVVTSIDALID